MAPAQENYVIDVRYSNLYFRIHMRTFSFRFTVFMVSKN